MNFLQEESEKTRNELGNKIDKMGEKVDNVGEKTELLRVDLREYIESNFKRVYEEIAEIKQALKKDGIM